MQNVTKWLMDKLQSEKTKREREAIPDHIQRMYIQQSNLQIQMHHTQKELADLCEKFNLLTQQLAEEGRKTNKEEHRRLEVDEDKPSV